jgi:hypothetical protein
MVNPGTITMQGHDNQKTSIDGAALPWNGQLSLSEGTACAQVLPAPGSPLPPIPAPTPLMQHQVCDANGGNCRMMLMADPVTVTPTCYTQTVTTHGTDSTTWFTMGILGALAGAAMALIAS